MSHWGVWTRVDEEANDEMIRRNAGVNEFVIVLMDTEQQAGQVASKLIKIYGDTNVFVRKV